jgi:hypothetical protein
MDTKQLQYIILKFLRETKIEIEKDGMIATLEEAINRNEALFSKQFRFKTTDEAEDYYWGNVAKHNEDEKGRDYWLESIADDIEESWLENNK